ncbi:class I SAM-dependent methyltransferase [Novosphingobium soli]|uniref:Methyltransferase domain-containing protein n=1 Tax=Novosphingobium soli TaxID=574956 RepID=A0ABV6CV35_9SPHN
MTHPMLAQANHDEQAEQLFVRDLKQYLTAEVEPLQRGIAEALDPGPGHNARAEHVYAALHHVPAFRSWAGVRRASQELLWQSVWDTVERQAPSLDGLAQAAPALGSLSLDPHFTVPDYLEDAHVHLMPGGYSLDADGVRQGAVMDRGGAVYMLGRNGGFMNDGRGQTVLGHLAACYPDLVPARLLELGCGIGASIVPVARAFPDAESVAIDVGSSMLRYAHARAAHLGVAVDFVQADAEATGFADESFDLVFSAALLHETSAEAITRIMAECHRLLRKGGVVVHLEVPSRYAQLDLWTQVRAEVEHDYNNEPAWRAATSADYAALLTAAGFVDCRIGFQDAVRNGDLAASHFGPESKGTFLSWFVASARKV